MIPENEKSVTDITQSRKSENRIALGNSKSNGAEQIDANEVSEWRDNGEDKPADKNVPNPGHDEETFPADANLFGQGRTTLTKEKPGWHDPK